MSLDDTGRTVWGTKRPPLGMLVSSLATETLTADLAAEQRAPFDALATALRGWWPRRKRDPEDIYNAEYSACLALAEHRAVAPALAAAKIQMAGLLIAKPRGLPPGDHYDVEVEDFLVLLRDAAKTSRLPIVQLDARLKLLLEHKKQPWPELVARAERMSWGKGAKWGKLDKRVRALAALADLGAVASWTEIAGQRALSLQLDGTKRIAMLNAEELESLTRVIPRIADAAG